jgi:outer membrane lipoprotein-sorting protein
MNLFCCLKRFSCDSSPLSLREKRAELATAREWAGVRENFKRRTKTALPSSSLSLREKRAELATAREWVGVRGNSERLSPTSLSNLTIPLTLTLSQGERGQDLAHSQRRERSRAIAILLTLAFLFSNLCASVNAQTTQPTSAPVPAPLDLITHLQKQLSTVESVQADFVQVKNLAVLKHKLTIRGSFALQKPDRVIWIVREPVRYAIRVHGEEVSQWDEDTNKVQVMHLGGDPTFKAISQQIQAWFLGDYKSLAGSYDVFLISPKPLTLRFAPKPGTMVAKMVSGIEVTFGADEMNIDTMQIHEQAGDNTILTFINTRLNQPVKKETWEIPPR